MLISPYKSIIRTQCESLSNYTDKVDMFNTISKIHKVKCPVKIVHGKQDNLISYTHSTELYSLLPNKKFNISLIETCGHNNILTRMEETYYRSGYAYFEEFLK